MQPSIEEARARIVEALEVDVGEHWVDEAVRVIQAHRAMLEHRRVYDVSTVGKRIRTAREIVGLNQAQLGDRVGVRGSDVSDWERGVRDLKGEVFRKLCLVLGVQAAWLLCESDEGGPPMPGGILRKQKAVDHRTRTKRQMERANAKAELERIRGLRPPLKRPKRVAPPDPACEPCPRCTALLHEPGATFCIADGCGWPGRPWTPDVGAPSQFVSGTQPE